MSGPHPTPWALPPRAPGFLLGLAFSLALSLLSGCSTVLDNAPQNTPLAESGQLAQRPMRDIVGEHAIALSLSGGGLRASAFALGVAQALAEGPQGEDLYGDLTFISSVSGGSLTAAYLALEGRSGLHTFRQRVLERNFEADLRLSLWSPNNLSRLLAGGLNDRSNLAATIDRDVFRGATFADLYRRGKPDVWINATDLYNRTPFPFIPPVFGGLCSDLSALRVSEAVAASMAVPLAFAPVVLQTYPERCAPELPSWVIEAGTEVGGVTAGILQATARAYANYRNPQRMRYVKLADDAALPTTKAWPACWWHATWPARRTARSPKPTPCACAKWCSWWWTPAARHRATGPCKPLALPASTLPWPPPTQRLIQPPA